jgi:CheY-like chemotaxis protein/nitrogen-specific signal transduction histidine kinase
LDKKYIVVKINEISDTIHREEELRREIEHVRSEEQQKSDFLSTMSHEIRTPMNGILGMITLAKNSIENKEDVLSCLDKANTLSQFLLSIINDILDLSKLESGKVILEHERFDLFECMSRLSELFRATIEGKGICFVTSCEDMDIRYVMGDSLRLMQVLTNFLSNANKYTEKGGEITVVFKQMNKADGRVHMQFRVKDTGKGMDPEFLNRIFKPFVQESSSTTRKYGGTGLGMAIADNLVRLMGGQIVVDTELGRGSEFSAYIPFDIAPGEQSLDDSVSESDMNGSVSLEGMRILMAEDNEINAEIACELFKMEGAELEIAKNGKIAVEKFEKCEDGYYDIIFMDIQMPEMDGWTAAKTIRAMDREYAKTVPIFALSANAFTEDKRHSVEIGMNGHVSKPIDFDELKKVLAKVMPAKK